MGCDAQPFPRLHVHNASCVLDLLLLHSRPRSDTGKTVLLIVSRLIIVICLCSSFTTYTHAHLRPPGRRPFQLSFFISLRSARLPGLVPSPHLIMFTAMRSISHAIALSFLLLPASARVVWMPQQFDPSGSDNLLQPRDADSCGGDSTLSYCGGGMPSGFCCSSGYICLALSTKASVQAAMCCPTGGNCAQINPISCDMSLQNTTITQLHAQPPQKLNSCGTACCPMGYDCENGRCVAEVAPAQPKSSSIPNAESSTISSATASSTSKSTSSPSSSATTAGTVAAHDSEPVSSSAGSDFDSKSFAAGFIPGIAIGAFIAALILLLWYRKRRAASDSYVDEKSRMRDTLTDLGPLEYRRPNLHGRSISEPQADMTTGHRTDFLRSTPPRAADGNCATAYGYVVDVPPVASSSPPRVRALFSRSPFMPQYPSTPPPVHPPVPAHLKRGTLSFKISPVRALKKQKSMHSLRRQMTDASGAANSSRSSSRRNMRPDHGRSESTETIQVLMPSNEPYTPDRAAVQTPDHIQTLASTTYQPPSSSSDGTWRLPDTSSEESPEDLQRTYTSSSRYPSDVQQRYVTPTRPPVPRIPSQLPLASPYTPTNYGMGAKGKGVMGGGTMMSGALSVQRQDTRRDTTFSALMEKAGLRKSDLLMGSGNGR